MSQRPRSVTLIAQMLVHLFLRGITSDRWTVWRLLLRVWRLEFLHAELQTLNAKQQT